MASLNLTPEEFKAVEQTRQRISMLCQSIGTLKDNVINTAPLPDLDSLQSSADVLQKNMRSLLEVVSNNNELFSRVAVHPSTNFPGRTQEVVLLQLLRKKPEPDVAASMDDGRKTFRELGAAGGNGNGVREMLDGKWQAASNLFYKKLIEEYSELVDDPYTAQEREMGIENVRTGLRRVLEVDYDDEDDDEDEDEEDGRGAARNAKDVVMADDEDLVMLDRPPQQRVVPVVPLTIQPADTDGIPLENLMRLASRGELIAS